MSEKDIYNEIVNSSTFQKEKEYKQHGNTTVYDHSLNVMETSFNIAKKLHLKVDKEVLMKGSLLHDYFLYDWHEKDKSHRLHGYTHPLAASINAKRMCNINEDVERIIKTHMWPLTLRKIPLSKEAFIVCLVDKILAIKETFKLA